MSNLVGKVGRMSVSLPILCILCLCGSSEKEIAQAAFRFYCIVFLWAELLVNVIAID